VAGGGWFWGVTKKILRNKKGKYSHFKVEWSISKNASWNDLLLNYCFFKEEEMWD